MSKPNLFVLIQFEIPNVFTDVFLIVGAFNGGNVLGITKGLKVGFVVGVRMNKVSFSSSDTGISWL
jgi:hypothetical protein